MTLVERVNRDIAEAMKTRDTSRLAPLRMLKTALVNREVQTQRKLDDPEARHVVHALVKQRRDSADQFRAGGRQDLALREEGEIRVLEAYLPPPADPGTIDEAVTAAILETGATSLKDLGRVMKAVLPKLADVTVDGRVVNEAVRRKLSEIAP